MWRSKGQQKLVKAKLIFIQRQDCMAITGAINTMSTAAMEARWAIYRLNNTEINSPLACVMSSSDLLEEIESHSIPGMPLDIMPNTTNYYQPYRLVFSKKSLDTVFVEHLKYAVPPDNWRISKSRRIITQLQVARLFSTAKLKAKNSFESCGIGAFNDHLFSYGDFALADVTDRPYSCRGKKLRSKDFSSPGYS